MFSIKATKQVNLSKNDKLKTKTKEFGSTFKVFEKNFKLEKNNDKWNIVDKSSKLIKFEKNQESDKFGEFISSINKVSKDKKEIRLSEVKTP
ncbi:MAG: hypothetical protein E6319_03130, partial [Anaerococcus vaginalis]|nr:hypothetical protein [Anaerococcus vaginalis]